MPDRGEPLRDAVYLELVRSLFRNTLPPMIMSAIFVLAFALIQARYRDPVLVAFGWLGIATSVVRLAAVGWLRSAVLGPAMTPSRVRREELIFATSYIAFAICLGLFGARVFALPDPAAHMLTIAMLVGYCAGVASGIGLRPAIAIPSMAFAMGPAIVVALLRGVPLYVGTSIIVTALLLGGSQSMLVRARTVTAEIRQRITFASLARHDGLTGLPNRLSLREHFETFARRKGALLAVHYLDLNSFKPVNDRFGHPVGDALLVAVAGRLRNLVRSGDIVARIGGDEFAITQCDLAAPEEADALAARMNAALTRPFRLGEHAIEISASIGTVVTRDHEADLDLLLQEADEELYRSKSAAISKKSVNRSVGATAQS